MKESYNPAQDMPDYVRWIEANPTFGYSDYLHAQVLRGALGADIIGALVGWLWPSFNMLDGLVILAGAERKCAELQAQQLSSSEIEYWANFTNIDGLLPGISTAFTAYLACIVKDIWQAKLNSDYPDMSFVVQTIAIEEQSEINLTFFQAS